MDDIGRAVTESARLLAQVGAEIDLLCDLVKQELSYAIDRDPLRSHLKANGEWVYSSRGDSGDWTLTDVAYSLALRRRRSTYGHLAFQVSLDGEGIAAEGNAEPLLHVCWWLGSNPLSFEDWNYMGFPLDHPEQVSVQNDALLAWDADAEDPLDRQWTYSLRLVSLNTLGDIRAKIVDPTTKLLLGAQPGDALPLSLEGLVRYAFGDDRAIRALETG